MAYQTGQTVYQLNQNLLANYLIEQLRSPAIAMISPESKKYLLTKKISCDEKSSILTNTELLT